MFIYTFSWKAIVQHLPNATGSVQFGNSVVLRLFATPWTTACQASLSFTVFQSFLKLMSTESVMPLNHLILCHSLLSLPSIFPSIRIFFNESLFVSGGQSVGTSVSASVFKWIFRIDMLLVIRILLRHFYLILV